MKALLFCALAWFASGPTLAEAPKKPSQKKPATAQQEQAGPEMQRLVKVFAGTWSITETSEPHAQGAVGKAVHGEESWYALGGGMPLIEEFHTKSQEVHAYDTAAIWWDATIRKYAGIWCAAFNEPGCTPFEVHWEGNRIVMDGDFQQSGQKFAWQEVFTFTSATAFTQTLDVGPTRSSMKRASTITAKRTGAVLRN